MIEIFLDGASIGDMSSYKVNGYTTNPSLIKASGITNYLEFAKKFIITSNNLPVSFEVLSRDKIVEETILLSSLGPNVFVKIPVDGHKNIELIQDLNQRGYNINATAVFTTEQVRRITENISSTPLIISIFAGRIADTGVDPMPIIKKAVEITKHNPNIKILWASTREVLNIKQAESCGCHIITVTKDILKKQNLIGKDLYTYSIETSDQFFNDAESLVMR